MCVWVCVIGGCRTWLCELAWLGVRGAVIEFVGVWNPGRCDGMKAFVLSEWVGGRAYGWISALYE